MDISRTENSIWSNTLSVDPRRTVLSACNVMLFHQPNTVLCVLQEFLDTEMTVPTSSGLPLSLTVKGTATVDLKASGKVDLRKVSAKPRSLQIDGEIRPR